MVNDIQWRSCNHLSKSKSLIFGVLLKHIDKKNTEQRISVIKGIVFCLIIGCFLGSMYKYVAIFMFVFCIGLAIYILACKYNKLAQINVQLRAILLQSENLNDQEEICLYFITLFLF